MEKRILKYVNKSPNPDLSYGNCDENGNSGNSGFDLYAWIEDGPIIVKPLDRVLVHTGIYLEIPEDCESIVYKYDNHYQLYLQDVNQVVESSRGHFVEFGEISQLSKDYLDEHGELFIKEQALDVLYQL